MSAYRRHMAEYFAQKAENYSDATAIHKPTESATPNEYEPGLEPKGMVTFDEAVHAAEMKQGYNDRDDESIGMRHRGQHQQSLKDRRDESKGMTDSMNPHHPYSDVSTMSAEGSAGDQVVSWENPSGVSSPSGPPSNIMWAENTKSLSEENKKLKAALRATVEALNDCMEDNPYSESFEDDYDALWENHNLGQWTKPFSSEQGYNDRDDESIGMRHRGSHEQNLKDRRDESKGMTDSMNPHHPYSDVSTMEAQGYNDKMDESLGMRHRGKHQQSFKDRRDEASAMDKDHSMMGRKYDDVMTMDAESAGMSGQGVPVSYGGIPLPSDAVAELDAGRDDLATVISEMGAETQLKPKSSKKPAYRKKGRAKSQGSQNDPCAKSDRACPLDANLWQRSKQRASKEYRVWPSPHASAYAVQLYNQAGGKWSRATGKKHPAAKSKNLNQNSLGNYYGGNYERKGEKGNAVDFSTRRVKTSSKGSAGDPFCGRAYTKDMSPEEFRKSFPRCLPKDGADNLSSRGQRKETLKKRTKLNKRKFTGGGGVAVPVDRSKHKSKKP